MAEISAGSRAAEAVFSDAEAVDVIIVNWNSGAQLRTCIESIARWADRIVRSVIVVDNASTDGSSNHLDIDGVTVTVVEAGGNLGFGRACNLGAADAEAPLLLFLNPDAALKPGALQGAVDFMHRSEHRDVAVVGIKLTDEQGRVQHHTTAPARFTTIFTHDQRATRFDHLNSRRVHHVIGAFYLIRSAVFRSVGGFDERFFMYLEDLDLSDRVNSAGWQVQYLADAEAFHKGGGVSEQVKARRLFYAMRSRLQYSFKHFSFIEAAMVGLTTLTVEPLLRLARATRRRSMNDARETLMAFGQLYRALPGIWRSRR